VVNLNRNAEVVHFLATRTLAYEGLDVLAHVGPVVIQADELGHGAVGTAMAHNSVVAHLKRLELIVVGGCHDVECGEQLTRLGGGWFRQRKGQLGEVGTESRQRVSDGIL
jgi:hypothetical protein